MAEEKEKGIGGVSPIPNIYYDITYNDKDYKVGIITKISGDKIPFIIDFDDFEKVNSRNWHIANGYIGSAYITKDKKRKTLFMHNFVMNKIDFTGKGSKKTIDHINEIPTDNRKCNLREIDQSLQNRNTSDRKKITKKLPNGFDSSLIPRNIWYVQPDKSHAERFCVEFKGIPEIGTICKKTTSSKDLSIYEKLELAIKMKEDIIEKYPVLKEYSRLSEICEKNKKEFEEIIEIIKDYISDEKTPKGGAGF